VCGIVGVFDNSGHLPSAERFATSLDRLQRRGPDDSGLWSNGLVRLGHRRLAILDLSPAGHQPVVSADGRHVIVFNGEIYNHAELRPQLAPVGPRRRLSQSLSRKNAAYQRSTRCASTLVGGPDAAVLRSTPRAWRGTTSGSHATRGVIRMSYSSTAIFIPINRRRAGCYRTWHSDSRRTECRSLSSPPGSYMRIPVRRCHHGK
jgi:hypothetical protein